MSPTAFLPSPVLSPHRHPSLRARPSMSSATPPPPPHKAAVAALYASRASAYHARGLHSFHGDLSTRLLSASPPPQRGVVLDLACGTGIVSLAAARAVGPDGLVVGVDLCAEMLHAARAELGRGPEGPRAPICYLQGDVEEAGVLARAAAEAVRARGGASDGPGGAPVFDAVYCSAAQVWFDDLVGVLRMWRGFVRPGGSVAFNAWSADSFVRGVLLQEVAGERGWAGRVPDWYGRTASPELCCELLREAGWEPGGVDVAVMSVMLEAEVMKDGFLGMIDSTPVGRADAAGGAATLRELLNHDEVEELRQAYFARVDEIKRTDGKVVDKVLTYSVVGRRL